MANKTEDSPYVTPVTATKPPLIRTIGFLLLAFILGASTLAGLVYGGVLPAPNSNNGAPTSQATLQKVTRTFTGNDADTDKREAVAKLTEIHKAIAQTADPNSIAAEVAEGNYDRVPEILKNSVVSGSEETRRATMVAIIYLSAGIGNSVGGADNIKPISDQAVINSTEAVTERGIVHIPQSIYTKTNHDVTVTMAYDDEAKTWKIDGYPLVTQVLMLAQINQALNATATPTASASPAQ